MYNTEFVIDITVSSIGFTDIVKQDNETITLKCSLLSLKGIYLGREKTDLWQMLSIICLCYPFSFLKLWH